MVKKDLKTVKSEAQNWSKNTVTTEKHFAGAIASFPPEANRSLTMPIRCCIIRICCPRSLLHILIEIRLSSRTAQIQPFPLRKNRCTSANCSFPVIFAACKASGLRYLGILKSKDNALGHRKIGSLKQTVWQLQAAKVRWWCGKTAACADCAWRRLLPLAEAIAMIS